MQIFINRELYFGTLVSCYTYVGAGGGAVLAYPGGRGLGREQDREQDVLKKNCHSKEHVNNGRNCVMNIQVIILLQNIDAARCLYI